MIEASAPVRICDNGGWTDTWFGGPGRVLNIAVTPGVEVSIHATAGPEPVMLVAESFGDRYPVVPGASRAARHPLLEAAIDAFAPPRGLAVEISVRSGVPAGCSTGTSAAVAVALLGGVGGRTLRAAVAARGRLRGTSARGRRPRRPERDPGPAECGVRRDHLPRDRAVPGGHCPHAAGLGGAQPPADAGIPRSRPRLLGGAPPGDRERGIWRGRRSSRCCERRRSRPATPSSSRTSMLSVGR